MLCTYLEYNTVVRLCHFFCCGGKVNFVQIFLFNPNFLLFFVLAGNSSGHETRSTGTCIPEKLGSPYQDMKPGPQGKLMYYYFYHGSDLREIIQFLREIECIKFECNEFVLVLVTIDLIHFEHSICISST